MSDRTPVSMTADEIAVFIDGARTVILAVPRGDLLPHVSALWFAPDGTKLQLWSYARSQKVVALRRDRRAVALLEEGDSYDTLRGVSIDCEVEIVEDHDRVLEIGVALARRYAGREDSGPAEARAVQQRPAKRVGLVLTPTRVRSWDHGKLAI